MEGPVIRVKGNDGHHRKLLGKGDRGRGKRGRSPFCFLNGRSRVVNDEGREGDYGEGRVVEE